MLRTCSNNDQVQQVPAYLSTGAAQEIPLAHFLDCLRVMFAAHPCSRILHSLMQVGSVMHYSHMSVLNVLHMESAHDFVVVARYTFYSLRLTHLHA